MSSLELCSSELVANEEESSTSSSSSSEESDHDVTVMEKSDHSDDDAESSYLAAVKRNLPAEEPELVAPARPAFISEFEREHFHHENVMPDRPLTAFSTASPTAFTTKDIFDALMTDGIPASAVRCLQRSHSHCSVIEICSL